jgi:hypothetical protein
LENKPKPWKLITTLKEREIRNLKQAAKDRQKRGSRLRSIPDKADLESLRAAKKQRREERKLEIIQERQEKAYIVDDKAKPWKLITTLKEREIRNLKQAAKDRRKRGSRVRSIPDEAELEALRASKKQKQEQRKLEIIQERQERAHNAELMRLELATARKSMPAHQRDIER